jgi:hypothetical protein
VFLELFIFDLDNWVKLGLLISKKQRCKIIYIKYK